MAFHFTWTLYNGILPVWVKTCPHKIKIEAQCLSSLSTKYCCLIRGEYTSKHLIILPEWPPGPNNSSHSLKKIFAEAVCETVGSVMNQHSGRNRHLQPLYFSIELVLRWNLRPMHYLNNFVEEVYNRDKK